LYTFQYLTEKHKITFNETTISIVVTYFVRVVSAFVLEAFII